ncbi:MAG: ATP-binding protein [Alphaproteobacteria bacterium]
MPDLTVHLRTDRGDTVLLQSDGRAPFAARPVPHRFLIGEAFELPAHGRGDLVLSYTAGGGSSLPFSIESETGLRAFMVEDAWLSGLFYAFSLASILFFSFASIATRSRAGLLYAALFALGLLLLAQIDGLAFQFLWPDWPIWNGYAALPLLLAVCALGFYVAGVQRAVAVASPRFRRAMNGFALGSLALIVPVPFAGLGWLMIAAYLLLVAMIGAHVLAGVPLVRARGGLGLTSTIGAGLTGGTILVLIALFLAGVEIPALLLGNIHRIAFLLIAVTTMMTLHGSVLQLRRDHERALEREVDAARRDAELNRELFESEKNYARARELAALRQRQLATATHDIKQPLASLRLSMDALAATGDAAVRDRLKEAFDYLEGLTGTYLAEARSEAGQADTAADGGDADEEVAAAERAEPYPLSLVTGTVDQMFREEAVSKGLAFEVGGNDVEVTVPVLPLMRLVSNLVSNAVKYTVAGRVAVLAGADGDGPFITVEDTGPGMSPAALAEFRQAGRKGAASQGEGLGMAIADDIAAKLGLALAVESAPGQGTRFRIAIASRGSGSGGSARRPVEQTGMAEPAP